MQMRINGKKYVLKNRFKFCTFLIIIFVVIISVFSFSSVYGYKEKHTELIKVKAGDNLWKISEKYNKSSDIREYIYDLIQLNELPTSEIYEGMDLKVIVE